MAKTFRAASYEQHIHALKNPPCPRKPKKAKEKCLEQRERGEPRKCLTGCGSYAAAVKRAMKAGSPKKAHDAVDEALGDCRQKLAAANKKLREGAGSKAKAKVEAAQAKAAAEDTLKAAESLPPGEAKKKVVKKAKEAVAEAKDVVQEAAAMPSIPDLLRKKGKNMARGRSGNEKIAAFRENTIKKARKKKKKSKGATWMSFG